MKVTHTKVCNNIFSLFKDGFHCLWILKNIIRFNVTLQFPCLHSFCVVFVFFVVFFCTRVRVSKQWWTESGKSPLLLWFWSFPFDIEKLWNLYLQPIGTVKTSRHSPAVLSLWMKESGLMNGRGDKQIHENNTYSTYIHLYICIYIYT